MSNLRGEVAPYDSAPADARRARCNAGLDKALSAINSAEAIEVPWGPLSVRVSKVTARRLVRECRGYGDWTIEVTEFLGGVMLYPYEVT